MGISTDAELWFGVILEEDQKLPWEESEDYDLEDWWQFTLGKENPPYVTTVNYCSGECPMYALILPNILINAHRGYPKRIDPQILPSHEDLTEEIDKLLDFCDKYNIKYTDGPNWYLSSYWG